MNFRNWTRRRWPLASVIGVIALFTLAACASAASSSDAASIDVTPYPTLDASSVAQGQQVYGQHCATCHGANLQGAPNWATPGPNGLHPAPAHDDSGHTWHHSDRVLYETIRDGMNDPLRPNSPLRMPAFKDKLSDTEIRAVIEYLKSHWSSESRQYQFDETRKDFAPTPTPH